MFAQQYIIPSQSDILKNAILLWDPNYLSYYRFLNGDLNDGYTGLSADFIKSNGSVPVARWDNIPNDMCYPFQNTIELP
jgi:hypothetical protein